MDKKLKWTGLLFTLGYLLFVLYIVEGRIADVQKLSLNEAGDFLAGIFGPVTVVWLILGFFQQGMELRQNNEALLLQAQELRDSVNQQRELVQVTREQMQHDRESAKSALDQAVRAISPVFGVGYEVSASGRNYCNYAIKITNHGAAIHNVVMLFDSEFSAANSHFNSMERNKSVSLGLRITPEMIGIKDVLSVRYMRADNSVGEDRFVFFVDDGDGELRLRQLK